MVSWGRLLGIGGSDVLILNTHLSYGRRAVEARRESARIVMELIADRPRHLPLFLSGDFNCATDGEVYGMFSGVLSDAWKTAQETSGPEGTLHGFGRIAAGRRIDWILHRNTADTLAAETITHTAQGLYASDH
jgi:endonuclease/exonuclease/phosphatase family metal-dependent hydrolase